MDQPLAHMDDPDELLDSDELILDALRDHGNLTKGALVDICGFSENTAYNRLDSLKRDGVVVEKHSRTRLWAIAEDPRDGETWDVDVIPSEDN